MIKVLNEKEIDDTAWRNLLKNSRKATFFQSPECYQFYKKLSFLQPFLYGVSNQGVLTGLVCGYLIAEGGTLKRFFSRRAIIPGGVLLSDDISDTALQMLLDVVKRDIKSKAVYVEIRNYHDYSAYRSVFYSSNFSFHSHYNIHVHADKEEQLLLNLNPTKRRQIKMAELAGVRVLETKEKNPLNQFYKILFELYVTKIRKPLFYYEFFEKIIEEDFCKLFVAIKGDKVIGGMLTVEMNNNAVYEWFICGDDRNSKGYPSVLLTWNAIQYTAANNFRYFDFMGAGSPEKNKGIRRFKSGFGGKLTDMGRYVFISKPFIYRIGIMYLQLIKKMK